MAKIELMWWILAISWIVIGVFQMFNGNFVLAVTDLVVGLLIAILANQVEMK